MGYRLLADGIALLHFAFLAFVVVGELLILLGIVLRWQWTRNFWFRLAHLAFIGIVVAEAFAGVPCPLTVWENDLPALGNQPRSELSFTARVVHRLVFCPNKSWEDPSLQWSYYAFGALVVLSLVVAPPRLQSRKGTVRKAEE